MPDSPSSLMVALTAIGSVQLMTSLQTFLRSYHNNYYGVCVRCSSTSTKQRRIYSVVNLYSVVLINTPEGKIICKVSFDTGHLREKQEEAWG